MTDLRNASRAQLMERIAQLEANPTRFTPAQPTPLRLLSDMELTNAFQNIQCGDPINKSISHNLISRHIECLRQRIAQLEKALEQYAGLTQLAPHPTNCLCAHAIPDWDGVTHDKRCSKAGNQ